MLIFPVQGFLIENSDTLDYDVLSVSLNMITSTRVEVLQVKAISGFCL